MEVMKRSFLFLALGMSFYFYGANLAHGGSAYGIPQDSGPASLDNSINYNGELDPTQMENNEKNSSDEALAKDKRSREKENSEELVPDDGMTVKIKPENPDDEHYVPIPELSYKKPVVEEKSVFDDVRIHAGAGFVNSSQNLPIPKTSQSIGQERASMTGYQISLGIDLFSPHWIAETDFISLPSTNIGDANVSTTAYELRFLYDNSLMEKVTFHGGLGIANRNYDIQTTHTGSSISSSFQSGATALVLGTDYWVSRNLSAGVELSDHLAMSSGSDPSSIDFTVRLMGHF